MYYVSDKYKKNIFFITLLCCNLVLWTSSAKHIKAENTKVNQNEHSIFLNKDIIHVSPYRMFLSNFYNFDLKFSEFSKKITYKKDDVVIIHPDMITSYKINKYDWTDSYFILRDPTSSKDIDGFQKSYKYLCFTESCKVILKNIDKISYYLVYVPPFEYIGHYVKKSTFRQDPLLLISDLKINKKNNEIIFGNNSSILLSDELKNSANIANIKKNNDFPVAHIMSKIIINNNEKNKKNGEFLVNFFFFDHFTNHGYNDIPKSIRVINFLNDNFLKKITEKTNRKAFFYYVPSYDANDKEEYKTKISLENMGIQRLIVYIESLNKDDYNERNIYYSNQIVNIPK